MIELSPLLLKICYIFFSFALVKLPKVRVRLRAFNDNLHDMHFELYGGKIVAPDLQSKVIDEFGSLSQAIVKRL